MRLLSVAAADLVGLLTVVLLSTASTANAQESILLPSVVEAGHEFGNAVGLSGSYAIVGASFDSESGIGAGAAHIFFDDPAAGWTEVIKLIGSDVAGNSRFGISVGIDGDYAIVGAERHNGQVGAAYVFYRDPASGWTEQAKLEPSDPSGADFFGTSVAISGATAVVGSVLHNGQAGAAYVFERTGASWTEQVKLTASDGTADDRFGDGVAIRGDDIIVTAPNAGVPFDIKGGAYVFVRDGATWTEQARLIPSDSLGGTSAAIDGDVVVLGLASEGSFPVANSGAAYVFNRVGTAWTEQTKLKASDARASGDFGFSLSLRGETLLVGAFDNNGAGDGSGAAYVFENGPGGWTETLRITASDGNAGFDFGAAVSLDNGRALIGDPAHSVTAPRAGAAYLIEGVATGTDEVNVPASVAALAPVYPNPATDVAETVLSLTLAQTVRVALFDLLGREVLRLHDATLAAGNHPIRIQSQGLAAGVYFLEATGDSFQMTRPLTIIRQ